MRPWELQTIKMSFSSPTLIGCFISAPPPLACTKPQTPFHSSARGGVDARPNRKLQHAHGIVSHSSFSSCCQPGLLFLHVPIRPFLVKITVFGIRLVNSVNDMGGLLKNLCQRWPYLHQPVVETNFIYLFPLYGFV